MAPDNDYGDVYLNTHDDDAYTSDDYQDNACSSDDDRKTSGDREE